MQNSKVTLFLEHVSACVQVPSILRVLNEYNDAECNAATEQEQCYAVDCCANFYSELTGFTVVQLAHITTALAVVNQDGGYITYLHNNIAEIAADWAAHVGK